MVRFFRDSGLPSHPSREATRRRRKGERARDLKLETLEPRLALAVTPGLPDTIAPVVRSVSLPAAGTYGTDRALTFKVTFSEPVKLAGDESAVTLPVEVGYAMREARYVSGSGTKSLVFRMTVKANDVDTDGISVGRVNSAAIRDFDFNKANAAPRILDRAGNPASNVIPAIDTSRIRVDTTGPVVASFGAFVTRGRQVSLKVTFDGPVVVKGKPTVPVTIGGEKQSLTYASGSGTPTLTFAVTMRKGASVANPAFRGENDLPGEVILLDAAANLEDRHGNSVTAIGSNYGKTYEDKGNRVVVLATFSDPLKHLPLALPPAIAPRSPVAPMVSVPPPVSQPPVVRSAPPYVLPAAVDGVVEVSSDITGDATFRAGTVYVITGEVHVRKFVTLTIEDGVEVRIRNGNGNFATITSCALIFDSGSSLVAENVTFQAADAANQPVKVAHNGGVFFCGGTRKAAKDDVSSMVVGPRVGWSFNATKIVASYLGRKDPAEGDGDGNRRDDIDAVSLVGVIADEWNVKGVEIHHSGDDGFDLTNSDVEMERVTVIDPDEDGVNLSWSYLVVTQSLVVDMKDRALPDDRELFDFEVNAGPSMLTVVQGASVDLRGYWDTSHDDLRISLRSRDMPAPYPPYARNLYAWRGRLEKGPAEIFSKSNRP